jgi:hypothetical protein
MGEDPDIHCQAKNHGSLAGATGQQGTKSIVWNGRDNGHSLRMSSANE